MACPLVSITQGMVQPNAYYELAGFFEVSRFRCKHSGTWTDPQVIDPAMAPGKRLAQYALYEVVPVSVLYL